MFKIIIQHYDTTQIIPVTNALDHVYDLRRLIASFDNTDETLHHLNKIENFLYSNNIKKCETKKDR